MEELQELIERTEWLQDQVESLQDTVARLQANLSAHQETLYARLAELRHPPQAAGEAGDTPSEPETASTRPNRRTIPRRRGNPVPVSISPSQTPQRTRQGWVIDRSPDGLCLVAEEASSVGALLKVRPAHDLGHPDGFQVRVTNCRPERGIWILGCRFAKKLAWKDLRLFS